IREQRIDLRALLHWRQRQRVALIHDAGQLVTKPEGQCETWRELKLVLCVKRPIVEHQVAQIGRAIDESRSAAGDVEGLAVAIDIAAGGGEHCVGRGEIRVGDARKIAADEGRLTSPHGEVESGYRPGSVIRLDVDPLELDAELEAVAAALPLEIVDDRI